MLFIICISRINSVQVDDAHNNDVVMQIYNLVEYCVNHSKALGILW